MFTNTHLRLMLWKNACQFGGARNAYGLGNYPLASSRYPYIGPRKPRYRGASGPGRSTTKTPVFCAVERQGELRRRIVNILVGTEPEALEAVELLTAKIDTVSLNQLRRRRIELNSGS